MDKYEKKWLKWFEQLKKFEGEHRHCNVPRSYPGGLGRWVINQRTNMKKGKLSEDRIERLGEVGFKFAIRKSPKSWGDRIEELKKFEGEHRHCNVPQSYPGGLGYWVINQRRYMKNGTLPQDRIEQLEGVGFKFALRDSPKTGGDRIEELNEFKKNHRHCNVPKRYPGGLGRWVDNQRQKYRKGELSEDRKESLTDLGFKWKVRPSPNTLPTDDEEELVSNSSGSAEESSDEESGDLLDQSASDAYVSNASEGSEKAERSSNSPAMKSSQKGLYVSDLEYAPSSRTLRGRRRARREMPRPVHQTNRPRATISSIDITATEDHRGEMVQSRSDSAGIQDPDDDCLAYNTDADGSFLGRKSVDASMTGEISKNCDEEEIPLSDGASDRSAADIEPAELTSTKPSAAMDVSTSVTEPALVTGSIIARPRAASISHPAEEGARVVGRSPSNATLEKNTSTRPKKVRKAKGKRHSRSALECLGEDNSNGQGAIYQGSTAIVARPPSNTVFNRNTSAGTPQGNIRAMEGSSSTADASIDTLTDDERAVLANEVVDINTLNDDVSVLRKRKKVVEESKSCSRVDRDCDGNVIVTTMKRRKVIMMKEVLTVKKIDNSSSLR